MSSKLKKYHHDYYVTNKERITGRKRAAYDANKEANRERARDHYWKHHDRFIQLNRERYHSDKGRYYSLRSSARQRGLVNEITFEHFLKLTDNPCAYCGQPNTNRGVDRVDNSLGYLISNCASCCFTCNYMKLNHNKEQFLGHIQTIYRFNKLG